MTQGVAIVAVLYGALGLLLVALYGAIAPEAFRHRYGAVFAVVVFVAWPLAVAFAVTAAGWGAAQKVVGAVRDVRADHRRQGRR